MSRRIHGTVRLIRAGATESAVKLPNKRAMSTEQFQANAERRRTYGGTAPDYPRVAR